MSRTITALFDSRADAEAAKARLHAAHVDADHVHIHDKSSAGFSDQSYSTSTHSGSGIWGSIKNAFLPDEDRHTYEEGLRRGGYLLTADVGEDRVDEAVRALEDSNSIDIDERAQQWRSQGWNYGTDTGAGLGTTGGASAFGFAGDHDRTSDRVGTGNEEVIPIVEEELVVGKREVERGGVRVRSYVTETPVHEQVRLREENVSVERRAVDQPLSSLDGDAFRDRTVEMTETNEEAVVGKTARVVEEVVIRKDVGERVEDVSDSVRRTEVDVDRDVDTDLGTTRGTDYDRR
jgi:uncharacterized protein (TIGR02271 family)